jgi:phage terminase large subunit GpA-like protein
MVEKLATIFTRAAKRGIPDGALNITTWASRNRYLSPEDSAMPGLYDPKITPYMIEVQDCMSDPRVVEVVLMTSAQVAKTTVLLNALGYYSDAEPSPILFIMPTEDFAKLFAKKRLDTMVRDSPVLTATYLPPGQQEVLEKRFAGGFVSLAGTNSPVKLSSQPIRIVLGDELDRMLRDVAGEGSPVALARKRTTTFRNRKIIWTSTPTKKGDSPIEDLYNKSDKRKYYVPCPHCGTFQLLLFKNVKWENGAPQDAWFVCEGNACRIEEEDRLEMIQRGEWRAEAEFRGRAGFWLNQWYSPFVSIGETVMEFLDGKDKKETLKVIVNTVFAETFDDEEKPEVIGVEENREVYAAEVPNGVLLLTASVDVQGNRLECEVVGWGIGEESWSVAYYIIEGQKEIIGEDGKPTTRALTPNDQELWDRLKTEMTRSYAHENGYKMFIAAVAVDTGGHHVKKVYEQVRRNMGHRWLAVKGSAIAGKPLIPTPTRSNRARVPLWVIGTEAAKDAIYAALKVKVMGPGYCHFPDYYPEEYFKQLTGEKRIEKFEKGKLEVRYIKIRARNEALDCRVYAYFAMCFLEPNWTDLSIAHSEQALLMAKEAITYGPNAISDGSVKVHENEEAPTTANVELVVEKVAAARVDWSKIDEEEDEFESPSRFGKLSFGSTRGK